MILLQFHAWIQLYIDLSVFKNSAELYRLMLEFERGHGTDRCEVSGNIEPRGTSWLSILFRVNFGMSTYNENGFKWEVNREFRWGNQNCYRGNDENYSSNRINFGGINLAF